MAARTIHVIGGPTASGKSALALSRAEKENGIIINADSMQIYNALPLLSAQPGAHDHARAPHALYGFLQPEETCSAAQWRELAIKEINAAFDRGQLPIIVGGTGFYIGALLYGLSPIPDVPVSFRESAMALLDEIGSTGLHHRLKERDPVMAARLHPHDTQRIVRAWETLEATGKSLAYWQSLPKEAPPAGWQFNVTLVMPEREELRRRCDMRFDMMVENGALEEATAFAAHIAAGEVAPSASITHALGFRPLSAHLAGQLGFDEAIEQSKAETRQYAKRQVTWFRHQIVPAPHISEIATVSGL